MSQGTVLLVGMTMADVYVRSEVAALAATSGASVGFLQQASPSLVEELNRLADAGTGVVRIVGVSTAPRTPAASWLRRVAGHWWRERQGHRPAVEVATTVLRSDLSFGSLDLALQVTRPVHGQEAPLTSAAWEHVPDHRYHVLVCRGPRCSARGAGATAEAIAAAMRRRGLGDDDVLLTQTGCLFPCNHAPVVCVHPDDAWYGGIDPDAATILVDTQLVAGRPLETHRLPRRPHPQEKP